MVDFTNISVYAYFAITLGVIAILVFGTKLFLLRRKRESNYRDISVDPTIPSEKELEVMYKELEKEKKPKKAELKLVSQKEIRVKRKEKKVEAEVKLEDTPQRKFTILKGKSKLSYDFWKTWYLEKYLPGKTVLINMELTNGFHKLFIIKEKEEGFVFRGKKYLFDDDSKYYNLDTKIYTFDYHEQIVLPFKRKIPVTEIKKTIESTEGIDVEYAINPSTLQRFMTAKIAEGVMRGTQLDEFMKKLQTFLIVTMVAVLVHLALFLYASGILQNLQVPGILG